MKIAICDDEILYCEAMETMLGDHGIEPDVYHSGEDLLHACLEQGQRYDGVFLDMEMDGLNGFETANALHAHDPHMQIVFVTSHEKYMIDSFRCDPLRFIIKNQHGEPVPRDRFAEALEAICAVTAVKRQAIHLTVDRGDEILLYDDEIAYCESRGHNILFYCTDGQTYSWRGTMAQLLNKLPPDYFVQCHRSFVVNLAHVCKVSEKNGEISLATGVVPIGPSFKADFLAARIRFMKERLHV